MGLVLSARQFCRWGVPFGGNVDVGVSVDQHLSNAECGTL